MKTLYLLRHAKSAWADPGLADHDRPLAPRGRQAAASMADYIGKRPGGPPPLDLVLCSTARRARETLAAVLPAWAPRPPVLEEDGLYLCGADALLRRLRSLADGIDAVLLIAHNPDLQELTLSLARGGAEGLMAQARAKYPTGALARLELDVADWGRLRPGDGRLMEFVLPRNLP
ncbi:MAG TPA: histidine phosphatase family protein [Azospirillaceae bacterium]|nr:histidine phosphatase family protein [Azospirillaceae bacterium]